MVGLKLSEPEDLWFRFHLTHYVSLRFLLSSEGLICTRHEYAMKYPHADRAFRRKECFQDYANVVYLKRQRSEKVYEFVASWDSFLRNILR